MISNGEIRKYVTERIKPFRTKVFGYSMVYFIIISAISSAIMSVIYAITSLIGAGIGLVLQSITGSYEVVQMTSSISNSLSSIIQIVLYLLVFILSVGFMKEILLCVNEKDKTSPVDFFRLGFQNYKKLIKVYFRMYLKYLLASIVMVIGIPFIIIGCIMFSEELGLAVVGIILLLIGFFFVLAGSIISIIIFLQHQTLNYDYIYDEKDLSSKDLVKMARENIKGYVWQWTKMNFFYKVIFFFAFLALILILGLLIFVSSMIITAQNGVATVVAIIFMILALVLFIGGIIAISIFMNYFEAKNILNLNELYKMIIKEKQGQMVNS